MVIIALSRESTFGSQLLRQTSAWILSLLSEYLCNVTSGSAKETLSLDGTELA